jgi:tetratricopeptide (TPR) repeat protein
VVCEVGLVNIDEWDRRLAELWAAFDDMDEDDFLETMETLTRELPAGSAIAAYEMGSAYDSTGHSDLAVPLYREALNRGLRDDRRRQAVIQLASSLRNLGEVQESIDLLTAELTHASDELDDAVIAFLALALTDAGREREAVSLTLSALSAHLPRYERSVRHYARLLVQDDDDA